MFVDCCYGWLNVLLIVEHLFGFVWVDSLCLFFGFVVVCYVLIGVVLLVGGLFVGRCCSWVVVNVFVCLGVLVVVVVCVV